MSKLIATTVVHQANQGTSHGGAYLVDLEKQAVFQVIDYKNDDIEWFGNEGGRGLRGIAFDNDTVYMAASKQLLAYDRKFKLLDSWQNPYLTNCHGLAVYQRNLFLVSTAYDCILAFDLDKKVFHWAMHVASEQFKFKAVTFDPMGTDGPLAINKLDLNNISCSDQGMHICGQGSGGLLYFNGSIISMSVELPAGARDARKFRDGVLFNDSRAGVLRYSDKDDETLDRAMPVPFYEAADHSPNDPDELRQMKRGYGRGLCSFSNNVVAGGFTPAGISIHKLQPGERVMTVTLTRDVKTAINCIEIWPFD